MNKVNFLFEILGEPKAQARHRHFRRGNFSGTYDPSKDLKESFASIIHSQAPREAITGPISLKLTFAMSRPKNHYRTGKMAGILKDSAPIYHTGRPDIDNLQKFVQDALNKIYYKDDSQICAIKSQKMYSEKPRTIIEIKEL